MEETNACQNEGRKQPKSNNGNRVEFRLSKSGSWIYESMAKFFWQKGYISKPTLGEAARFCFNVIATDFIDHGEAITQKLEGIIPIRDYNKLELELSSTKSELTAEKQVHSLNEKAIETHIKAYETQRNDLENVRNTFSDFRVITSRIGKRIQEMAQEGGYLEQGVGQFSEAPRIILKEWKTALTEEQSKSLSN